MACRVSSPSARHEPDAVVRCLSAESPPKNWPRDAFQARDDNSSEDDPAALCRRPAEPPSLNRRLRRFPALGTRIPAHPPGSQCGACCAQAASGPRNSSDPTEERAWLLSRGFWSPVGRESSAERRTQTLPQDHRLFYYQHWAGMEPAQNPARRWRPMPGSSRESEKAEMSAQIVSL